MPASLIQCLRLADYCKKDPSLKLNHTQHNVLKDLEFHRLEHQETIEVCMNGEKICKKGVSFVKDVKSDLAKIKSAIAVYKEL